MSEKHFTGRDEQARVGQDSPYPGIPDQQLDPIDYLSLGTTDSIAKRLKRPQSSRSPLGFCIGLVVSGAVGLSLGCLILYLVLPKDQFHELTSGVFGSAREETRHPVLLAPVEPARLKVAQSKPVRTPVPRQPRQMSKKQHLVVHQPQSPKSSVREAGAIPSPRKIAPKIQQPQPAQSGPFIPDVPKITTASPPQECRGKIVFDLSHPVHWASFPKAIDGGASEVIIEDIAGLGTPHVLEPIDGVIRAGHPVNLTLPDYPNVRIQISFVRGGAIVEAAPMISLEKNRETALTQQWASQSSITLNKELDWARGQLLVAETTARNISTWLKTPGPKPLQLRGVRRQQLYILNKQIIPNLTENVKAAQARINEMKRLVRLIDQIDGVAVIRLVLRQ